MTETAAPIARAFRIPATITNRCRPARIDYNINDKEHGLVSLPDRQRASGRLHRSHQSAVQRHFSAAALFVRGGLHACVFAEPGELFQSRLSPGTKACSARAIFRKRWRRFPSSCRDSGANAPFTTLGGLDNTWVQGRRAARFFINDNLAWSHGAHELRFGTNTRIFRLNDYDFGEGAVPTRHLHHAAAVHLWRRIDRHRRPFPLADSQPYNFLNLDLYAQDTWKVTRTLTWTFGVRDTLQFQSAESASARSRACAARSIPSRTM